MTKIHLIDNRFGGRSWTCNCFSDGSMSEITEGGYDENNHTTLSSTHISIIEDVFQSSFKEMENSNLLVFPKDLLTNDDDLENKNLLKITKHNNHYSIETNNMVGYIGKGDLRIDIHSRFDTEYEDDLNCTHCKDKFLHYMLKKVMKANLFDLSVECDNNAELDYTLMFFPFMLKTAVRQGVYKDYVYKEYNDANIKGPIDVARHLRLNIPFCGKVAYSTRELSYNNRVTMLIRHTIEYISTLKEKDILTSDEETKQAVEIIRESTPDYCKNDIEDILDQNSKEINHPYYTEYVRLQKLCLTILHKKALKYGPERNDDDKVFGIVFDAAWLWEEYINIILTENKCDIVHPNNRTTEHPIYLFKGNKSPRYPDFYMPSNIQNTTAKKIILDAKYKHFYPLKNVEKTNREDLYQMISYMYVLKGNIGAFIFPYSQKDKEKYKEDEISNESELNGYGGKLSFIGFEIPETKKDFEKMTNSEKKFIEKIQTIINSKRDRKTR